MLETQLHRSQIDIDWSEVWARVGEDADLLSELLGVFLQDAPQYLIRIRAAIELDHGRDLAVAAHGLKGSVGVFGLKRLVRLLEQVESLGHAGRAWQAMGFFGEALDEMSRAAIELKRAVRTLGETRALACAAR